MEPIYTYADALPTGGLTVLALRALDFAAPGQWSNPVGFDHMIQEFTGESDPATVARIRGRAVQLFEDTSQGYQRGLWIYQMVDSTDRKLGVASLAHQVGERFSLLGFLARFTPKQDTTQAIDLSVKLVAELAAFCYINGLPGDSIGDFVAALGAYERESLIRMAALVAFDGVLPLGPEFLEKVSGILSNLSPAELEGNATFQHLKSMIPGGDTLSQLGFIGTTFSSATGWIGDFIARHGLTPEAIFGRLQGFLEGHDGRMDTIAGFLDVYTNYFEHTGTQSLCRSLIERAVSEI